MNSIKVKENILELNQTPQSYGNMWLRYIGIRKNGQAPDRWVNKVLKSHQIYAFVNIETDNIIEQ